MLIAQTAAKNLDSLGLVILSQLHLNYPWVQRC